LIAGYEQLWQVRDHLNGLKKERRTAIPGREIIIDREIERFETELARLIAEQQERLKAKFEAEEAAARAAAGL
jgi:hypothetical protein